MNNRKKQRNRKIVIGTIIVAIIASSLSLFGSRSQSGLETIFSDSMAVAEYYLIKKPITVISDIFSEYNSLKDVYSQNKLLKEKLDSYASIEANTDVLSNEINKLKEAMNISILPIDTKYKTANVTIRDVSSWSNEITIDVGTLGEVETGMVVTNSKAMIGIVSSTTEVSATVSLLTNESPTTQLPVMILNGNETVYGLLDGYDVNGGNYRVTLLTNIGTLDKNAKVYTSGLGGDGKSPKGIYIGKAKELSTKSDGTTNELMVKKGTSFDDLSYVTVVQRVTTNE